MSSLPRWPRKSCCRKSLQLLHDLSLHPFQESGPIGVAKDSRLFHTPEEYHITFDRHDLFDGDDIRLMDAHKIADGKPVLQILHIEQGHGLSPVVMDGYIIPLAFDVVDIPEIDLEHPAL